MAKKKFDYHQKNLKNPFSPKSSRKKRENRIKKIRIITYFLLIISIFIFLGWFLLFSNFWQIKKVEISGLNRTGEEKITKISNKYLEGKLLFFIPKNNLLFFHSEELSREIKDNHHFEQVEVKKSLPDKLKIEIAENTCAYILKQGNSYYWVDKNNYIVDKTEELKENFSSFPLIEDQTGETFKDSSRINLKSSYVDYIQSLVKLLAKQESLETEKFILDQECQADLKSSLIKMKLNKGPVIYFNGEEEPEKQIERLILVKDKLGSEFNNKQYITLEYGDRIFYK